MKAPHLVACLLALLPAAGGAQTGSAECEQAWADYRAFKDRTVMEQSQYPLTIQGAAVRAACGENALPAPARTDAVPVYGTPAALPGEHRPDRHHRPPAPAPAPAPAAEPPKLIQSPVPAPPSGPRTLQPR